jgi:hypothetical protein
VAGPRLHCNSRIDRAPKALCPQLRGRVAVALSLLAAFGCGLALAHGWRAWRSQVLAKGLVAVEPDVILGQATPALLQADTGRVWRFQ